MYKPFLIIALLLGALSVVLGAFGAHGLKSYTTEQILSTYETAVRYQFYHVFALALTSILYNWINKKQVLLAGRFFIAGIFVFSGSLYVITLFSIMGIESFKWIGAFTPLGGLFFITGWILLAFSVHREK